MFMLGELFSEIATAASEVTKAAGSASLEAWWAKSVMENGPWAIMVLLLAKWLLKRIDELISWHKTYVDKMAGNYDTLSTGIVQLEANHKDKDEKLDLMHIDIRDVKQKVEVIHGTLSQRKSLEL